MLQTWHEHPHFNSIKVQLELPFLKDAAVSAAYFNSIKVQLELNLGSVSASANIKFQFHKGTIRT